MTSDLPRRVVTVGSFDWTAKRMNLIRFLAAADGLFARNGMEFHVIGRVPDHLRASLGNLEATRFVGYTHDLGAEFDAARAALVFDDTGGGFKLKMLDYLFNRVPIFGLRHALEGLPPKIMAHTVGAATMPDLAERVVAMIDDVDGLDRMQSQAAQAARGLFEWGTNGRRLVDAVETACRRIAA
jgi:glycosyltransferase involved in cell wall biosynthesis